MFFVFYSTSNVFKAEEILKNNTIESKIVPTPVQDRAYCGVCVECDDERVEDMLKEIEHVVI